MSLLVYPLDDPLGELAKAKAERRKCLQQQEALRVIMQEAIESGQDTTALMEETRHLLFAIAAYDDQIEIIRRGLNKPPLAGR